MRDAILRLKMICKKESSVKETFIAKRIEWKSWLEKSWGREQEITNDERTEVPRDVYERGLDQPARQIRCGLNSRSTYYSDSEEVEAGSRPRSSPSPTVKWAHYLKFRRVPLLLGQFQGIPPRKVKPFLRECDEPDELPILIAHLKSKILMACAPQIKFTTRVNLNR